MKRVFNIIIYLLAGVGLFLLLGWVALELGLTNTPGGKDLGRRFQPDLAGVGAGLEQDYLWAKGEEWATLEGAISKDAKVIEQAARVAGIDPRLLTACLVVEQLRLYHSEREVFKQVFSPLVILGNQSQFSWGVMGMKRETAVMVERFLKDKNSPYYLGARYEQLLDFETNELAIPADRQEQERFVRLVNEDDHYWSYLYSAIYLKQVAQQWQQAGYPIDGKVGVLATLFNIGFTNSKPKADPKVGGAMIEIGEIDYTFGGLAEEFYYSSQLTNLFPIIAERR